MTTDSVRGASRTLLSHSGKPGFHSVNGAGSGSSIQPIKALDRPLQRAVSDQLVQGLAPSVRNRSLASLQPSGHSTNQNRAAPRMRAMSARSDKPGRIVVAAPDKPLGAVQAARQGLLDVAIAAAACRRLRSTAPFGTDSTWSAGMPASTSAQASGSPSVMNTVSGLAARTASSFQNDSVKALVRHESLVGIGASLPAIAIAGKQGRGLAAQLREERRTGADAEPLQSRPADAARLGVRHRVRRKLIADAAAPSAMPALETS